MAANGEECSIMNRFHKSVQVPPRNHITIGLANTPTRSPVFLSRNWLFVETLREAIASRTTRSSSSIDVVEKGGQRELPD